ARINVRTHDAGAAGTQEPEAEAGATGEVQRHDAGPNEFLGELIARQVLTPPRRARLVRLPLGDPCPLPSQVRAQAAVEVAERRRRHCRQRPYHGAAPGPLLLVLIGAALARRPAPPAHPPPAQGAPPT